MELFDPTTKPEVANIEDVPADFRPMYVQKDGKHVLDAENPVVKSSLSVFSSLKGTLTRARKDLDDQKKKSVDLSPLVDFGATPAEIAQKIKEQREALESQIKGADPKKIREGVEKEWTPKLEAEQKRSAGLQKQLYSVLVSGEATKAVAAEKAVSETAHLLYPVIEQQVKVIEKDGAVEVHVVDSNGETRYSGANRMTVSELVKELKSDSRYKRMFESDAPAGQGVRPGSTSRSAAAPGATQGEKSSVSKISSGLQKRQYSTTAR